MNLPIPVVSIAERKVHTNLIGRQATPTGQPNNLTAVKYPFATSVSVLTSPPAHYSDTCDERSVVSYRQCFHTNIAVFCDSLASEVDLGLLYDDARCESLDNGLQGFEPNPAKHSSFLGNTIVAADSLDVHCDGNHLSLPLLALY
jgi:hypothetical protein